ncbi:MAG: orotidine-5'-phosphate decarboxylase [Brevinematia bacterium]
MIDRIIVAIDVTEISDFSILFERTKEIFKWYKIHSIFLKGNREVINVLKEHDKKIFLDLKFFDIPATVEKHIKVISELADMFTVHLLSGSECLKRVTKVSQDLGIIPVGVSILTSFSDQDLNEIGINYSVEEEIAKLVELGMNNGISHFVCSPIEVPLIKKKFPEAKLITPGIRITNDVDDQKRVTSPKEAFSSGADFIIMGRDLFRLDNPKMIENYL